MAVAPGIIYDGACRASIAGARLGVCFDQPVFLFTRIRMPYLTITATQGLSADQKKQLLERSSDAVVRSIGAPLKSVRVLLNELSTDCYMDGGQFGGKTVMYEVDFIEGRNEELKSALIAALSKTAHEVTGLSEQDIRVRLSDFPKTNMGMAGGITAKQAGR
jgi:4-oxalocrotonate tautomerase family enzyme